MAFSDYAPRIWSVKVPRDGFVLALAHEADSGEGVLWVRPDGSGTIIVSGFGSLFSNRALGHGDNARLLANIVVGVSVAPQGAVLFDDEHQGLSADLRCRQVLSRPRACTPRSPRSRQYGWCGYSAAPGCGCHGAPARAAGGGAAARHRHVPGARAAAGGRGAAHVREFLSSACRPPRGSASAAPVAVRGSGWQNHPRSSARRPHAAQGLVCGRLLRIGACRSPACTTSSSATERQLAT